MRNLINADARPTMDATQNPKRPQGNPEDTIAAIAAPALRLTTPCNQGEMPWRIWGTIDQPTLLLLHGGSGSWTHWIRNIEALASSFRVIAPDLPGLGESADMPEGYTVESTGAIVCAGLKAIVSTTPIHVAAFSWGCTMAGQVALSLGEQVRSLFLTGPAGLGEYPRGDFQGLRRRWRGMSEAELYQLNRDNLARLMIHQEDAIDDLAVYVQTQNTNRSRFDSPQFARSEKLLDAIHRTSAPLSVIYGEFDRSASPHQSLRQQRLQSVRKNCEFAIVPKVGHWTQFEWPGYNQTLTAWLKRHF